MGTYYVDPNASGANNGTSWGDAWITLQSAADALNAGDTAYCRNTETLSAPIDFDTNSGSLAAGYIKFIGCNAAGSVDGTFFVLDGNGAAANCIRGITTAQTHLWFENFEFKNATDDGVQGIAGDDYWIFINCSFNNNDACGFENSYLDYLLVIGCIAYSNSNHGFASALANSIFPRFAFCVAHSNGDQGIRIRGGGAAYHCLTHDNGDSAGDIGIAAAGSGTTIMGSVMDGEVNGMLASVDYTFFLLNRITNNTTGIDFGSKFVLAGWNYLYGNTTDLANPAAWSSVGIYAAYVAWKSTTNSNKTGIDDGYNDRANDDFNLKASRTYNGDGNDVIDLGIGS